MKICCKCNTEKPLSEFQKRKYSTTGITSRCKPCIKEDRAPRIARERAQTIKKYHENHAERLQAQRDYQAANREKYRKACKKWRKANPVIQKFSSYRWEQANHAHTAARAMRNYTTKRKRTPKWLSKEQHEEMLSFYTAARWLTEKSGVKHNVDHVVPLHGVDVCGLHVPWNLQILTQRENIQKYNLWNWHDDA